MSTFRHAIALALLVPALLVAQDLASLSPQAGLLVLRNGQVMQGNITRAGDHYIVTFGAGGEVKIAAKEVEAQCADIAGAYDYKLRRLSGDGAAPHLDLAEWCLRHHLHRQCAEQLSLALAAEPEHKRIEQIDRRLQLALQAPAATKTAPASSTIVSSEQLDKTLRDLPKGSLERFTTIVQPMLNNRCATSHCHGGTSTSEFRLLRPPAGLNSPQRFTQRNLYAVLQFVDRDDPLNSEIFTKPQSPHGGGTTAAFDARGRAQMLELQTWLEQLANRKDPPTPITIDPQAAQLSTPLRATPGAPPAASTGTTSNATSSEPASPSDLPHATSFKPNSAPGQHPVKPASATNDAAGEKPWQPRDPFDPEIFNRRYGKK
jgi:hypothetical protein